MILNLAVLGDSVNIWNGNVPLSVRNVVTTLDVAVVLG